MCRGLEIQVVSESDAAFLGARIYKRNSILNASGGYFLNIDSGKGTTDFSILQQQANFAKFNSLYRDGIPAAGNVITYAYYEALYDFMKSFDIDIHPFFEDASKASLIDFMGLLEELKKQDQPDADLKFVTIPAKGDIINLVSLVQYLINNRGRKIPCAAEYVDRKLTLLVDCLKDSLEHYMKMNKCTFTQVILSGRALLYHPYKEKLIQMLMDQQWIASEENVVCRVRLRVSGYHNIYNALATAAACSLCGVSAEHIKQGLENFRGACRRMEYKGSINGAEVYDDYGHHPTEIAATLSGAKKTTVGQLVCVYQPHTYSRTAALFDDFATAFENCDKVIFADIYAAREINTSGVSTKQLAERIGEKAVWGGDFKRCAELLTDSLKAGDVGIVMGAGDVYKVFEYLDFEEEK